MTTTLEIGLSIEEFVRRYDEQPFELIDGESIPLSPNIPRSSRIAFRLGRWMAAIVDEHGLGEVFIEVPFVMTPTPQWVKGARVPDVMFVQAERLKALAETDAEWETHPLPVAPDIAVEVMSPTDRFAATSKKARRYLEDGVQLVWVIDPERHAVFVYEGENITPLGEEDTLKAGDLIPDFAVEVSKLFA